MEVCRMQTIWIDAAEFQNRGGWRLESQFVRSVGQSYLIALKKPGTPVTDATTSFTIEKEGMYRIYVRTKNWKFPEAPGRFLLAADGEALPNTLGKMPTHKWYWEIAGDCHLTKGEHLLSAIDKTGWLARFSSVIITNDMDFTPSPEIDRFLKQRANIKGVSQEPARLSFDYVVVGAGPSGVPAAVEAARNGLKTALISGRPTIGGNASKEGTIGLDGAASNNRGAWEGGIANEIRNLHFTKNLSWQASMEALCKAEPNLTVFTNELCIDAETENGHILSATTVHTLTLQRTIFSAPLFCDCTGDGWLGYYAGAAHRVGREAQWQYDESLAPKVPDTLTMSGCLCDEQEGMPHMRIFQAGPTPNKVPFTAPDWAIHLPEGEALHRKPGSIGSAAWWLENSNDHDDLWDDEFARDEMIRLGLGYFHWLKNSAPLKPELAEKVDYYELRGLALHNSKRENRRLMGDYVFTQNDCVAGKTFPDTISYCGWHIDVHHPKGIYSGKEGVFYSVKSIPLTPLPYRMVYSKNIDNLFMAGRCCSVSHMGLGPVRVESTLATLGQATGAAAFLCLHHNTTPRGIYEKHVTELQQLLLRHDLTIPRIENTDEKDLARTATVTADSTADDVFLPQLPGSKDVWVPLSTTLLAGPYENATEPELDHIAAELKNNSGEDIVLHAMLWDYNDREDINTTIQLIDECDVCIDAGFEGYCSLPFQKEPKQNHFAVSFSVDPRISWRKRIWVGQDMVSYEKGDGQINETIAQSFELLYNSSLSMPADCAPKNVINGQNRPTLTSLNGWASKRGLPASITLTLKEAKEISEVRITTQVELSYPNYCFKQKTISTGTAEDLTVCLLQNGVWNEVAHMKDNCFKQILVRFAKQPAEAVKITVNKSINSSAAHITEVRIYE